MGIPRLRHLLQPFAQNVLLQGDNGSGQEGTIQSLVIDGPSLVYSVFSRLLSWFSESSNNLLEAIPTCNEVSCGVMIYLLQLKILGVKIERIYFDGALPIQKHETRVLRLENSRKKLELFCAKAKHGFEPIRYPPGGRVLTPKHVLCSRALPSRYRDVPDSPFMVPTVFEDLNYRWNKENIALVAGDVFSTHLLDVEDFPWANTTFMIPGEADTYCVDIARLTGCSILTNDSDLLLYDLGEHSSVVFLDSVELIGYESSRTTKSQIKASVLSSSSISRRLGVPNILSFAFELKCYPSMGMVELIQRSKALNEVFGGSSNFTDFAQEYRNCQVNELDKVTMLHSKSLDTRVSELFWMYEFWKAGLPWDCPRVYLVPLTEDHARQCAWVNGQLYRNIGYSILNLSRPDHLRFFCINEVFRRGTRVVEDNIPLYNKEWLDIQIVTLLSRLMLMQNQFEDGGATSPAFWVMLALCDLYGPMPQLAHHEKQKLVKFLKVGYMGQRLEWQDIHLAAQIQAILYSLRILGQLLQFSSGLEAAMNLRSILNCLPPLHVLMGPLCEMTRDYISNMSVGGFADIFSRLSQIKGVGSIGATEEIVVRPEYHKNLPINRISINPQCTDDSELTHNYSANIFEYLIRQ